VTFVLDTVTIDCADPGLMARFWAASLGWDEGEADGLDIDEEGAFIRPNGTTDEMPFQGLYFQKVPEGKIVKNRLHLDVRPLDSMDKEVERSVALGATIQGRVDVEGSFWTVMLDPEGNEFCILRGPEDGWSREQV
jgi:predicted enzyme related to lactoylglutathione lyase